MQCIALFIFAQTCCKTANTMKKKTGFEKFHKEAKSGRVLKEKIRQEKKQVTKERKAYFEKKRQEEHGALKKNESTAPPQKGLPRVVTDSEMPLNKYLANSGVCSG